jgi:hypothetical protein
MTGRTVSILMFAALFAACGQKPTQQKKVESTQKSTEDGQPIKSQTEVKQDIPGGTTDAVNKTYVGTVTAFTAGRKISVQTAEGKIRQFDLDEDGVTVDIEPTVRVGSRVEVIVESHEGQLRKLSIIPHA